MKLIELEKMIIAAHDGDATQQRLLGLVYQRSHGGKEKHVHAMRWFQSAASGGDGMAHELIGDNYRNGVGVALNDNLALRYYQQAARLGRKTAAQRIARAVKAIEGGV